MDNEQCIDNLLIDLSIDSFLLIYLYTVTLYIYTESLCNQEL